MKDFLTGGLVYVPAWIIGRKFSEYFDPFIVGWMVSATAVIIRIYWFDELKRS